MPGADILSEGTAPVRPDQACDAVIPLGSGETLLH
jgi:hypothetical protein